MSVWTSDTATSHFMRLELNLNSNNLPLKLMINNYRSTCDLLQTVYVITLLYCGVHNIRVHIQSNQVHVTHISIIGDGQRGTQ